MEDVVEGREFIPNVPTVLVAIESTYERAILVHWAILCGNCVASITGDVEQMWTSLQRFKDVRLIVSSAGRLERAAREVSNRAARSGRFVPVYTVDMMAALADAPGGLWRAMTQALSTFSPLEEHARLPSSAGPGWTQLRWGPIQIDPEVDRVWVHGVRNDAVRGELYVLLRSLLSSPNGSVTWQQIDETLGKVRSRAAHRKMAQRLREALGEFHYVVKTFAGGLELDGTLGADALAEPA